MNLKAIARVARSFKLEIGDIRAQGAPAVILAVSGLVLASGFVRLLNQNAAVLPEALREAKALVEALRRDSAKRLPS